MYDYLVVGAGPSGLCVAKTILQCEPEADLRIIDANKTVGGVWALENIYPGLKTNNVHGQIDFSDFPMHQGFGVSPGQHVSGEAMHNYIKAYAERSELLDLIDFGTSVVEVTELEQQRGWNVKVQAAGKQSELQTAKLIIATGVTNKPHRPTIQGAESFSGPIIHSGEIGTTGDEIIKNDDIQKVAVLGGGKSAYDAVYYAATAGRKVDWIMRKSGKGPEWVFPSHTMIGPFRALRERLTTRRFISFFSPCIWKDGFDRFRYFFHSTTVGKFITQKFWAQIHAVTIQDCGMLKDERTKILEPEQSPFWYGTASGVYSYENNPEHDIYSMIKSGRIQVHREDISHLSSHTINLGNGTSIPSDALITATGFSAKPTLSFFPPSIHSSLGIPSSSFTSDQTAFWSALDDASDLKIRESFPRLLSGPFHSPSSTVVKPYNTAVDPGQDYTPFRLYRAIAPPGPTTDGTQNLVFISMFSNLANTPRCELQCLWAYAYLNNRLNIDRNTVYRESSLMSRYCKWRAPYGHGRHFPDLVFDQLPYMDMLLQDLGLPWKRKGSWFSELFSAYGAADYKKCLGEWMAKEGIKGGLVSS